MSSSVERYSYSFALAHLVHYVPVVATARCAQAPGLWKSDIDSAFRRIPVKPEHRWATGLVSHRAPPMYSCFVDTAAVADGRCPFTGVAYLNGGSPQLAWHNAMPFGATSSVVAWHRIGELISTIARRILHLPVLRYVDDYFAADR